MDNHHEFVVGRSGFGKSTYSKAKFFDLIRQYDRALCYIDPHGPDALHLLDVMPRRDIKRTVYIDPTEERAVAFNPIPKPEVAIAGLKSIWIGTFLQSVSGWGPSMEYLLLMGLHALHANENATFKDLPALYYDRVHRAKMLQKVTNPDTRRYWTSEYKKVFEGARDNPFRPILNKIGQLNHSPIARVLCQRQPKLDLEDAIREKKIIIVNLNSGVVGDEGAGILGSLIATCLRHALKSLNHRPPDEALSGEPEHRLDLFADEFHKIGSAQFASMLSEDRKSGLTLHMSIQYLSQLSPEIRDAILGNVRHTTIFNVQPDDAQILARLFDRDTPGSETFLPANLTSLPKFAALMDGVHQYLPLFDPPAGKIMDAIKHTRLHYGRAA